MDNRISGKFVADNAHLKEVDTVENLEDLLRASVHARAGQVFEIVVTIQTSTDEPWTPCPQLGYWSTTPCGELLRPGTECTATHYHRPKWVDGICFECTTLGITPSHSEKDTDYYNHKNTAEA